MNMCIILGMYSQRWESRKLMFWKIRFWNSIKDSILSKITSGGLHDELCFGILLQKSIKVHQAEKAAYYIWQVTRNHDKIWRYQYWAHCDKYPNTGWFYSVCSHTVFALSFLFIHIQEIQIADYAGSTYEVLTCWGMLAHLCQLTMLSPVEAMAWYLVSIKASTELMLTDNHVHSGEYNSVKFD